MFSEKAIKKKARFQGVKMGMNILREKGARDESGNKWWEKSKWIFEAIANQTIGLLRWGKSNIV